MESEVTKKLQKKTQQQEEEDKDGKQNQLQISPSPLQTRSPMNNRNLEMSPRSSLHSVPPTTVDSPPDSPTVSSIPDSHGSSPHTVIRTPSMASVATKTETPFRVTNGDIIEEQKLSESRRQLRPSISIPRESKWASLVRKAFLGFRVSAFFSCLVSFAVMVADRDKGWADDSFYNYKEFTFLHFLASLYALKFKYLKMRNQVPRLMFCLAANVIGFLYSGFLVCDLVYLLSTSIRRSRHNLRHFLEFAFDQILAYLLASASTSASIRVDDWESNWGADKFPDLARASVSLSFVSFVSFAFCSLASGFGLCALRSI